MSNKIVICYDLHDKDDKSLREEVVKILKNSGYKKIKLVDTLWEKELSNLEENALNEFNEFRKETKSKLEDLVFPVSNEPKKIQDSLYKLTQVGRSKLNIKFYLSIKDEEEEI